MSFPIDMSGQVRLADSEPATLESLSRRVERCLQQARASEVTRTGNSVTARVSAWGSGLMSWDALSFVDGGCVEVLDGQPKTISYRFTCRQSLGFSMAGLVLLSMWLLVATREPLELWATMQAAIVVLVSVQYSIGYFLAAMRIPSLFDDVGS